jgi:HEAT repeat protein
MRHPAQALVVVALVVGWAAVARAEAPDGLHLLLGAEQPPSPAALARVADDPVSALLAIAQDDGEPTLLRRRAVIALGHLDDRRLEPALADLVETSPEGALRRAAATALHRLLAQSAPERLVPRLAAMLRHPDPSDREVAVWLLARVPTADAAQALADHRVIERNRAVVDALRRVLRDLPRR